MREVEYVAPLSEDDHPRVIDPVGRSYSVGDTVLYATTAGRSPVVKVGTVEKINYKGKESRGRYVATEPLEDGTKAMRWERYETDKFTVGIRCSGATGGEYYGPSPTVRYPSVANIFSFNWPKEGEA
jgi:hypothetical protein